MRRMMGPTLADLVGLTVVGCARRDLRGDEQLIEGL